MLEVDEILERAARAAERVAIPADRYERLLRLRERRQRERRIAAAVVAIILATATFAGLARSLRDQGQPADRNVGCPPCHEVIRVTGGALVAVDPGTGKTRTLVDDGAIHGMVRTAALSADGGWLAYSDKDGLWVMRSSGNGEPRLIRGRLVRLWAWSPTETQLAVIRPSTSSPTHHHELILINPSSGRAADLGDVPGANAWSVMAWSPDGTRIAYGTLGGSVYSLDVKSGDRSVLVRSPAADGGGIQGIDWSPDGAHLAIVTDQPSYGGLKNEDGSALYLANADGSDLRLLDGFVAGGIIFHSHPDPSDVTAWSPDGTRLAYADFAGPHASELRIWTVGGNGSAPSLVGSQSCASSIPPTDCWQGIGALLGTSRGIAWSPDGSKIAFDVVVEEHEFGGQVPGGSARFGFFAVNADGTGDPSRVDELTYLSWRGGWYYTYLFK
jgi:WD40 repeat protein